MPVRGIGDQDAYNVLHRRQTRYDKEMVIPRDAPILTTAAMRAAEAACVEAGTSLSELMDRAGAAVADTAWRMAAGGPVLILCGPGNNGGDGYVAARALQEAGAAIAVYAFGDPAALKGDAAEAFARFSAAVLPLADYAPLTGDVVIDALFGAGLSRDLPDAVIRTIEAVRKNVLPVLAVDLPSGIDGRT
ncbi:MAG: NAD(P)H-hydrate epimerase, partial [Sphingopyxis sp.]